MLSKERDEDCDNDDNDGDGDDDTVACSDGYSAVNKEDGDDDRSSRRVKRKRANVNVNHANETNSSKAYANNENDTDSDCSSDDDDKKSVLPKRKYKKSRQGSTDNSSNTDSRKVRGRATTGSEKRGNWKNINLSGKVEREDNEDSVITWEHVMYAVETNYKETEKKGLTKLFVHQDLPELQLTPGVIYRTQQRLLKLYGGV